MCHRWTDMVHWIFNLVGHFVASPHHYLKVEKAKLPNTTRYIIWWQFMRVSIPHPCPFLCLRWFLILCLNNFKDPSFPFSGTVLPLLLPAHVFVFVILIWDSEIWGSFYRISMPLCWFWGVVYELSHPFLFVYILLIFIWI